MPHTMFHCDLGLKFLHEFCPVEILSCGNAVEYWERTELADAIKKVDPTGDWKLGRKKYTGMILKKQK